MNKILFYLVFFVSLDLFIGEYGYNEVFVRLNSSFVNKAVILCGSNL